MARLVVNSDDPTPPFEQIRRRLALLIDAGELREGQRLPTVRQLAGDLRVAPGTVSRAFKELETGGYVETRRAAGTRVKARIASPDKGIHQFAETYVKQALDLGATPRLILAAVEKALVQE